MKKLPKSVKNFRPLIIILLVMLIAFVVLITLFLGDKYAVDSLTIKRVTPSQIANAMQGDYFFSSYRENTLIVQGTVLSVDRSNNDLVVSLVSSSKFKALCDFGNSSPNIKAGETITVLSEGAQAERQSNAVMLKDCVIP
jgi:hypothetical protein